MFCPVNLRNLWNVKYNHFAVMPGTGNRLFTIHIAAKTPFNAVNTQTSGEFACNGIMWVAGIISLQWPVLKSILHDHECSGCVLCLCACVCLCVACDGTKILGYHALMCMQNPLVLSHNLPVWLWRFSSAS